MPAWVALGAAAIGAVGTSMAADSAASAQQNASDAASANANKALDAQVKQSDDLLSFNKQQYEEGKTRQVGIDAINKQVVDQNLSLSGKAGQRADESYDFYKTNGRPLVDQTLKDSQGFDSQGNIDAARGRATADTQQGFDNSEAQSQRALTRMGVNPSSGRFLALQQRMQADKSAALAGAGTNAEEGRRYQAIGLRQQASNLASGMPAQSLAQGAQSSGTANSAAGAANLSAGQNSALTQQAMSGMQAGAGIYGNAASGYAGLYGSANSALARINEQSARSQQGWGNLAGTAFSALNNSQSPYNQPVSYGNSYNDAAVSGGAALTANGVAGFADGGKVSGPGTGTSDSVPAVNKDTGGRVQLSNGEFVISSDVVRKLGTKYFEQLQAKHHTPVNLGRAAA